jgi:hypothetical protein
MLTKSIRPGTLLTPLPRMRTWKLVSETATLDHLSMGRVILSLGIGWRPYGYQAFTDEVSDNRIRAELLDDDIDVLTLLYAGKPVSFRGRHYHLNLNALDPQYYPPPPIQQSRIPLWVVGVWPRTKSMRRVLKCDGLIPTLINSDSKFTDLTPAAVTEMKFYVAANRTLTTLFDIIIEGSTVHLNPGQPMQNLPPGTKPAPPGGSKAFTLSRTSAHWHVCSKDAPP